MFDGRHSHDDDFGGAHSHDGISSGGSGGAFGGAFFLALFIPFALVIGALIVGSIVTAVENNHDRAVNQTDKLILSAHLTAKCLEVLERHGSTFVGPRCWGQCRLRTAQLASKTPPIRRLSPRGNYRVQHTTRNIVLASRRCEI